MCPRFKYWGESTFVFYFFYLPSHGCLSDEVYHPRGFPYSTAFINAYENYSENKCPPLLPLLEQS